MKYAEQRCPNCGEVNYTTKYTHQPNIDGEIYLHAECNKCKWQYCILTNSSKQVDKEEDMKYIQQS